MSSNWRHEGRFGRGRGHQRRQHLVPADRPDQDKWRNQGCERVFDERRSVLFKTLQVVRFFDKQRNVLVYVAYSDRVIEGSPKNSISSVPIMAWPEP